MLSANVCGHVIVNFRKLSDVLTFVIDAKCLAMAYQQRKRC